MCDFFDPGTDKMERLNRNPGNGRYKFFDDRFGNLNAIVKHLDYSLNVTLRNIDRVGQALDRPISL